MYDSVNETDISRACGFVMLMSEYLINLPMYWRFLFEGPFYAKKTWVTLKKNLYRTWIVVLTQGRGGGGGARGILSDGGD